nr:phage tail protein [Bacillus infantis]
MTNRGRNLMSRVQTGALLKYTRIALGDGNLGTSAIPDLTALKHEVKSLAITKLRALSGGRAVIGTVFKNADLTSGFYFREIGVFAEDPDTGAEILYCYGNAGSLAEYIPAGSGADVIEKSLDVGVIVGNAPNISAVIDESLVYATYSQLMTVQQELTEHKDNKNNPHSVTKTQVGLSNVDNVQQASKAAFDSHLTSNAPHQYGGKFEWRFNSVTNSLDLVML